MNRDQYFIDELGNILVTLGALQKQDVKALDSAFRATDRERFEEFLVDEDVVGKDDILKALQVYYQLPAIDVVGILFDHALLINFPKAEMLNFGFIPFIQDGETLQVIASIPTNSDLLEVIGHYVNNDIVFRVGLYRDICDAVKEFYDESVATLPDDDEERIETEEDIEDIVDSEEGL